MSKIVKDAVSEQLTKDFQGVGSCLLVGFEGMGPEDATVLRKNLRQKHIRLRVVKNSLAAKVFDKVGMKGLGIRLVGQSAVAFAPTLDAIAVAKAVVAEKKAVKKLTVKGAYLDGRVLDAAEAEELSKLPGREELLAAVLGTLFGPVNEFALLLQGLLAETHGLITALAEKREEEPAPADPAGQGPPAA